MADADRGDLEAEETIQPASGAPSAGSELTRGELVDRFVILERLGAGAMGVVYAAYDPSLDRKVALKLIRPDRAAAGGQGQARLLKEAQALARLSHPAVVTVYDVGTHGGQVFLAMEFVAGKTLRAWLAEGERSWREVLATFRAAGEGLAAAHDAGLVHCDFKPDNVLVGDDRRTRVGDFGLAELGRDGEEAPAGGEGEEEGGEPSRTRSGVAGGTPPYMAPELQLGRRPTPLSDQFSFCVALHEGLYGRRPFSGATIAELHAAVAAGRIDPPPPDSAVPAWLRRAVLRGLSVDPDERYPSMAALLAALSRDPRARRRQRALAAGALGLIAIAAFSVARQAQEGPSLCRGLGDPIEEVWNPARASEVRAAFMGTGAPYAADAWRFFAGGVDSYKRAWVAARTDACEATHQRGEQSAALLDLRMRCLDRRREELTAVVDLAAKADRSVVENAVKATSALTPLSVCADAEALATPVPPPEDPEVARRVAEIEHQLAGVKALLDTGSYAEAMRAARAVAAAAREIPHRPIQAEASLALGSVLVKNGEYADAEEVLWDAVWAAEAGRHDEIAARAWSYLLLDVGFALGRPGDARPWFRGADAAQERAGRPLVAAELERAKGLVLQREGLYQEARERYLRARALRAEVLGEDDPLVSDLDNDLGVVHKHMGEYDEALAAYGRALASRRVAYGAEHPVVADVLNNMGNVLLLQKRVAEAEESFRASYQIRQRAYEPDHVYIAGSLNNLGNVLKELGRHQEALDHYQRSLAIKETKLGADSPRLSSAHYNIGLLYIEMDDLPAARAAFERALALAEKAGPDHPSIGTALVGLCRVQRKQGRLRDAVTACRRALAIYQARLGPSHPELGGLLTDLGRAHSALGEHGKALSVLERALAIRGEGSAAPAEERAFTQLALAAALVAAGRDRARAVELVQTARAIFAGDPERLAGELAEADRFLAAHARR
ncbi:MAG TPA: serine/threonine-protein kinase [Kofleriaceae bacterium]|nr:serine/threonine-protein kinase [Kofleriaceae bacterium]